MCPLPRFALLGSAMSLMLSCFGGTSFSGTTTDGGSGGAPAAPYSRGVAPIAVDAIYVVNGESSSISVIDASRSTVLGTIELVHASFPHHIYLSKDRSTLLLAVPGMDLSMGHDVEPGDAKGAVMTLDAKTGRMMAARRLDAANHNAIYSADEGEIWTSQMTIPGKVLVLDPTSLATKAVIDVGDMPAEVTFSMDGRRAFVADGASSDVTVVDVATKVRIKTIRVGEGPVGAWPGADGVMYVDAEQGRTVTAIDSERLEVIRTYELRFTPGMAMTTPSASELWVTNADGGTVAYYSTHSPAKLGEFPVGAGAHGIAFAPDGKTAWITNQVANSVAVVDVSSHAVTATIAVGVKPNGIVYRAM